VPEAQAAGGAGKAQSRNPAVYAGEKSDTPIRAEKPPNKGMLPAEAAEQRGVAKGNTNRTPASRTQSRNHGASRGLEGVREAARRNKRLRFTALLHRIAPELLTKSFYALKRQASAGVDGVTWKEYESLVPERIPKLHREIHTGAYRALPSRRVFIPKADGRQRPLGIERFSRRGLPYLATSSAPPQPTIHNQLGSFQSDHRPIRSPCPGIASLPGSALPSVTSNLW
jgi:hypothetical protein